MNVNWDYDGPSISQTFTEIQGLSAYQTSYSWVTAQASYEFLPGFKVYAEGKNLTNAIARTYLANRQDAVYSYGDTNGGVEQLRGTGLRGLRPHLYPRRQLPVLKPDRVMGAMERRPGCGPQP